MVAIVTGKGPGLETGSGSVLGGRGTLGSAATGRSDESVYVNAATGNLVVSDTDEMLVGVGPDAAISRTYNSLGTWDGDNDDYWRASAYRRVFGLTGGSGYGTAGSTVKRTDWDGSEVTYSWSANYFSTGVGAYVATDGAGAHDILVKASTVWTWTDGGSGITESYDDSNSGRITARTDRDGNAVAYSYTGALLTRVTTADGGYTSLVYGGTGGLQLQYLETHSTSPTATTTRVFYEYDGSDRLSKVKVNLAPGDNSSSTGANYETTYTYDGASQRVASIAQSDGTLVEFGYTLVGSDYRVTRISETVGNAPIRITGIAYDTTNRVTTITDAAGQNTRLTYDANNNLIKIVTPPVLSGSGPLVTEFGYDADGNVTTQKLSPTNTVASAYDGHGNLLNQRDSMGNTVARTYSAKNELLTETSYTVPDPDGAGSGTPSGARTTTYIYDAEGHVRYAVSPEGRVTEYRYDGFGQQVSKIDYAASSYASTLTEAALNAWVAAMTDRSESQRTDTWYDFRGNVSRTVTYAVLNVYGEGTQDPAMIVGASGTTVTQQPDGLYRVTKTAGTTGTWSADAHSSTKVDGDFTLLVKPNQNTQPLLVGLSTAPAATSGITAFDYAFYLDFGNIYSWEAGTPTSLGVGYAAGDSLTISRVGSTISYYKGATLLRTVTGATGALYFDSSLGTIGSSMDIGFTPQSVVNGANTSVVRQPDGMFRATKIAGGADAWDADARGTVKADGDFVLRLRVPQGDKLLAAGLSTAPGTNASYTNLNYGFLLSNIGGVSYTESGSYASLGTTYVAGDNFWIARSGTTLKYYKGATYDAAVAAGALRTVTGVSSTLYFDSSLDQIGAAIDMSLTPVAPVINGTNTSVALQSDGLYRITKTGGGADAWDADARGTVGAAGDFVLRVRPPQNNKLLVAGVAALPASSASYTNVNYGLMLSNTGAVSYMESGSYASLGVSYAANDNFWLVRSGSTVSYYKGATLDAAIAAGALRTVTGATGTLYFDSSLDQTGAAVDVLFTPAAPEISFTDYVYDPAGRLIARRISKPDASVSTESLVYDGMGRITTSTDFNNVTTTIAYTDATTSTTAVTLASGLVQTSTYNRAGELISFAESGSGVTTATTTYLYDILGRLRAVTDPTGVSKVVLYDAIGRKIADVDADGSVTEYRYDANGNLTSSTAYANKLTAAQVAALIPASPAIVNGANTSVAQQSDGLYRITKTGGGTGPDADARGAVAATGDFVLEIKPLQNNQPVIIGASTAPATSSGMSDMAYGIYLDFGTIWNWPAGTAISYGAYSAGDHIFMERVGSTLNYYKGANLAAAKAAGALGTVAGVSTATMYFDSTLYAVGSQFEVGFTPTDSFDAIRPATDATNDRWNFNVYDLANRLVETIDGTGSVTQMAYDGASQLVSTTRRANLVSSTNLTALKAAATTPNVWASPNDGTSWSSPNGTRSAAGTTDGANAYSFAVAATGYEQVRQTGIVVAAGDVASFTFWVKGSATISAVGFGFLGASTAWGPYGENHAVILSGPGTVADTGYCSVSGLSASVWTLVKVTRVMTAADTLQALVQGGAVVGDTFSFAKPIVTVTPSQPVYLPTADATNDRVSRVFYDNDGRLTGTLDAEGYLTQTIYDSAGRKIRTIAWSGVTSTTYRASGTFAQLSGSITVDAAKDIRNYWLYDARGLLRASIDGEGIVTRYDYSPAGHLTRQSWGQKLDPATIAATPPTLATLAAPGGSEVISEIVWTRNLYGQPLTESRLLTGSTYTTTTYTYDSTRRLTAMVTQSGVDPRTYSRRYDKRGRLTSELSAVGNAALAALGGSPTQTQIDTIYADYGTTYVYDAAGRLISKTGPRGTASGAVAPRTLYYYTADGNLAYQINSWSARNASSPYDTVTWGEVAEYRYNAFGERTDTILYAIRMPPATFATLSGGLATAAIDSTIRAGLNAASDTTAHTDFNVNGTVKQVTDPLSYVSTYAYNAFGELITQVVPRDGSATVQTSLSYDRRGMLKTQIVDSAGGGKAITTSYGYDAFGRTQTLTNANSKVTTSTYDRKGRLASVKDALNNTTYYAYDARDNLVAVTDARGGVTRYVYDKAGRRTATIDAMGGVSTTAYWPDGQVQFTRDYATRISLSGLPLEVTAAGFTPPTGTSSDHVTSYNYDKDGQLRFTIDGLNHVVEAVYDTRGNIVRTIAYDGAIAAFTAGAITTDWVAGQVASLASAPGNRVARMVYDARGRLTYTIDAAGQVTWSLYSAKGLLTRQIEFAATYSTAGDPLITDMDAWRATYANATNDRTTRAYYDTKGQLNYSIDALGFVTRLEYDKLGNVKVQTRYADAYSATDSTTLAILNSDFASPPNTRRVTEFNYDSAGRLEETLVTIQLTPSVIKTSTKLVLDQMGQITSSTAAYGTADASTTVYTYDDVGHVTSETLGNGASEAVTRYYYYDAVGNNTASVDGDKYLTVSVYDALGNRTSDTRYAGVITGTVTTALTVSALQTLAGTSAYDIATSAAFDTFGRVASSTDARGSVSVRSYDVLDQLSSWTDQLETGSGDDRLTTYTYNNFGELAKTHDARGNDSFAWYDLLGRVTRAVDAERYVTDTSYNRGGKVAAVKRYDVAIAGGVTVSETSKPDPLGGATFSLTGFSYDKLDQLVATTDAMSFTESYTLNAFGERAQVRNKLHGTVVNGVTLDTNVYYTFDGRGLVLSETLPVTTKNSGGTSIAVVNSYTYDLRGNQLTKTEAAGAVEARTTTYVYDKLNRTTQATGDAVTVVNDDLTSTTGIVPTQTYKYDRRGNVIESKEIGGARTLTWYDHVGNAVAQVVQTDKVSGTDKGVLTRSSYDANGNVASSWTYGDLISLPANANGTIPTAVDVNNYRLTSYTYYRDNRLKETKVAGLTTGEWSGSAYVVVAGMVSGSPNSAAEIKTLTEYDADGNTVHRRDERGNDTYMWYDKLGRMVASVDTEGYLTTWSNDAEGNVLVETRFATKLTSFTPGSSTPPSGTSVAGSDRITNFVYDRNGRRTEEKRLNVAYTAVTAAGAGTDIAYTDSSAFSKVNYTYNGLGQVLTKTEANLADIAVSTTVRDTTTYSYDTIGRLTLELGQSFTDYQGATASPRTAYVYDGLNNLKSTRVQLGSTANDTNDRVTTYAYGAGGRLASMTDATGKTHDYGYDVAGRKVRDSYTRYKSDGSSTVEAAITRYDIAGREITRTFARLGSGSVWKFTVSDTGGAPYYDATRIRYNAYGEVTGRGITGGTAGPNDTAVYQEVTDYDAGGRIWRTNADDGVLRFYVYDKAGNQTLTLTSAGADLSGRTAADYTALIGSTGAIAASGSITAANAVTTVTTYDKRSQATTTREPGRQLTGSVSQLIVNGMTYNAFGDVVTSTDARGFDSSGNAISFSGGAGYTTTYTYNTMGRLVSKVAPQVAATSAAGATTNVNPTEYYGYDVAGRLVSTRDANNNRTTRQLLAGTGHNGSNALIAKEFHPDSGIFETKYDVFGDAKILRNELYNPSSPNAAFTDEAQTFDKLGRLTSVLHRGGLLTDSYTYDVLGQKLTNTETWLVSGTPTSVTAKTDYDTQGRIVRQETSGGDVTTIAYSWSSTLQALDVSGTAIASAGGWVAVTTTPNTARSSSVSQDLFGHATTSTDMGGNVTNYRYDRGGRTVRRTISTDTYTYSYYNNGRLAQTAWTNGVPGTSTPYDLLTETYTYDAAGNQLTDLLVKESGAWQEYGHWEYEWHGYDYDSHYVVDGTTFETGSYTVQDLTTTYDALNRMVTFDAADTYTTPVSSIDYYYDANSNIRRTYASFRTLNAGGDVSTTVPPAQDYWYRYDSMNRVLTAKGMQSGSTVVRGTTGTDYSYNGASQRITAISSFLGTATVTVTDPYDPYYGYYTSYVSYDGERDETYTYTADGQVATVRIAETSWYDNGDGTITVVAPPSTGALKSNFTYDPRGRLTRQLDYLYNGDYYSTAAYDRQLTYTTQGQIYSETVNQVQGGDTMVSTTYNYYTDGGGYALGAVTSSSTSTNKNGSWYSSSTTTNTYNWREGTAIASTNIASYVSGGSSTSYTTSFYYTVAGTLTSAYIGDGQPRPVGYTVDTTGQIIRRDEGYLAPHEVWYRFGGRQLGYIGNNGTLDTDYQTSINNRTTASSGTGLFQFGSTGSTPNANFDQSLSSINSYSQGGASGTYTVRGGETLSAIASQLWGDSSLWYKLAEANGLNGSSTLTQGQVLAIPGGVMRSTNRASTFQPYDAAAAMGDTSPTAPAPPTPQKAKKKGCGIIGQILMIAIAIAIVAILKVPITSFLAGGPLTGATAITTAAGASLGATIAGGAIAGAIGSVVSQAFGVITGIQDKFNWKSVAIAGISGGVGAGLGTVSALNGATGLAGAAQDAVRSMVGSALTQGISVATGLQKNFDLVGIAVTGVAAGIGRLASDNLFGRATYKSVTNAKTGRVSSVVDHAASDANQFISGMAGAVAGAATKSVLTGTDFGDNIIAALPGVIGRTLGKIVAREIKEALAGDSKAKPQTGAPPGTAQQVHRTVEIGGGRYRMELASGKVVEGTAVELNALARAELQAELKAIPPTPRPAPAPARTDAAPAERAAPARTGGTTSVAPPPEPDHGSFSRGEASLHWAKDGTGILAVDLANNTRYGVDASMVYGDWTNTFKAAGTADALSQELAGNPRGLLAMAVYTDTSALLVDPSRYEELSNTAHLLYAAYDKVDPTVQASFLDPTSQVASTINSYLFPSQFNTFGGAPSSPGGYSPFLSGGGQRGSFLNSLFGNNPLSSGWNPLGLRYPGLPFGGITGLVDRNPFRGRDGENRDLIREFIVDPIYQRLQYIHDNIRAPDFYSFSLTSPQFNIPIINLPINVSFHASLDRNGHVYLGAGPGEAISPAKGFGVAVTGNWINQIERPDEAQLQNFLSGPALNVSGGWWLGASETYSPSSGDTATGIGFTTPGVGVNASYSWDVGTTGVKW
ncbi:MAG: LysM peptidoglycan-binding domain-containing protein [Pseudomonadota bacterium]